MASAWAHDTSREGYLSRANNTDCLKFLQWPLIVIGASIMVVSLAGFAGACYRNTFLMWLYLFVMFFIIGALIGFIIFAYAVTDKGSGRPVMNKGYLEYYLPDYSGWLRDRVVDQSYWAKISACIRDSKVCSKMGRSFNGVPETYDMFSMRKLSPIEYVRSQAVYVQSREQRQSNSASSSQAPSPSIASGCCKPPTDCGFVYVNETVWTPGGGLVGADLDCQRWSNDQQLLCYQCDSCKAGVLGSLKKSWRKVSVINIVVLILLVIFYVIGCAAFRNNRRIDNDEPYGEARMTKARPSHFQL
ncbi:Tetraspanin/Peripherin [Corchorus capsularis]|uniref:Tetraspanin/Peripherin n=1 Tax=Corchorus capsularis TaxID=210143 RepID=A0A1R3HLP8_COCAP|nr:Tetraspanin/Peripherin [Corchorus capsularis]